jgi:lipoate-protein ligase A
MRLLVQRTPADPTMGLATEEALLESVRRGGPETARLWVNRRAVVVGRSQCVADEVDIEMAQSRKIPVLRRISGGGTVYHYPGNLNLSIFTRAPAGRSRVSDVFEFFGRLLADALGNLAPGSHACENGLYVGPFKVGGAAQARRGNGVLYHTTLLVRPPAQPMETLLLAMRPGYRAAGVASRPRSTTSLSEYAGRPIAFSELVEPITHVLARAMEETLTAGRLTRQERLDARTLQRDKYGGSQWNLRW